MLPLPGSHAGRVPEPAPGEGGDVTIGIDADPVLRAEFERVGGGAMLNNSPYDLAAAALVFEEAGAPVTDAYGRSLHDRPLLGSGHEFQMSLAAAANLPLHEKLVAAIDAGMSRLSG